MNNYPEQIEDQRLDLFDIAENLQAAAEKADAYRDNIAAQIAEATGKDGKPLFGNEAKRKAELFKQLEFDDEFERLTQNVRALTREKEVASARLERLRNEFAELKLERRERIAAAEAVA